MRKIFVIYSIVVTAFISVSASSQTLENKSFVFISLEESLVKVDMTLDNVNKSITLTLPSQDTLSICDYSMDSKLERMEVINRKFLVITFRTRGGSEMGLGQTMIICVSHGHLYKALDIISKEDFHRSWAYNKEIDSLHPLDENETYAVSIVKITNDKKNNYKLTVTQYDKVKSKQNPSTNHETLDTVSLYFDQKNKVFYDKYIQLEGGYTFIDNYKNEQQINITGEKYPGIERIIRKGLLGYGETTRYIYINKIWYSLTDKNQLLKEWDICEPYTNKVSGKGAPPKPVLK